MKPTPFLSLGLPALIYLSSLAQAQIVNPANGHTYQLTSAPLNFGAARAEAVALGGYLVAINDQAEQTWILSNFPPAPFPGYWIGLTDEVVGGSFQWDSGEPFTYSNWCGGEPNNGNGGNPENYVYMSYCSNGGWNDAFFNNNPNPFGIIEIPSTGSSISIGAGCSNSTTPPALSSTVPLIGQPVTVTLTNSKTAMILASPPPSSPINFGSGCVLYLDRLNLSTFATFSTGTPSTWGITFVEPNDPSLIGTVARLQAAVTTPGGPLFGHYDLSNAIELTIGS